MIYEFFITLLLVLKVLLRDRCVVLINFISAKLAYGFLCLEWPEDKHIGPQYKLSIIQLLDNWIDNESSPLNTVTSILEWLPDEVSSFENVQSTLTRMPSINRSIFQFLYKRLFTGLIKGINISLLAVNT